MPLPATRHCHLTTIMANTSQTWRYTEKTLRHCQHPHMCRLFQVQDSVMNPSSLEQHPRHTLPEAKEVHLLLAARKRLVSFHRT